MQEFVHIEHTGGYGSVIGDGSNVKLDICDQCFKDIFEVHWARKQLW